jgi:hypothetical protein
VQNTKAVWAFVKNNPHECLLQKVIFI